MHMQFALTAKSNSIITIHRLPLNWAGIFNYHISKELRNFAFVHISTRNCPAWATRAVFFGITSILDPPRITRNGLNPTRMVPSIRGNPTPNGTSEKTARLHHFSYTIFDQLLLRVVLPVKSICTLVTLVIVAVMLTACDDIYRVLWSPDGARVAVLTDNGLRLGDATGSLSKEIPIKPKLFRWLTDSSQAVWVTEKQNATWAELKQFLSAQQQVKVGRIANSFWNYRGDPNNWKPGDDLLA